MGDFTITTELAATAAEAWARAITDEGINDELRPLLRMTMPADLRGKTIDEVSVGEPLGRSLILLGGVLPVDYDDLCVVELEPGRRFRERSRTLSFSVWQHERVILDAGPGRCTVTDRLHFDLKPALASLPGAERLARTIVAFLFRHRHRRLLATHS